MLDQFPMPGRLLAAATALSFAAITGCSPAEETEATLPRTAPYETNKTVDADDPENGVIDDYVEGGPAAGIETPRGAYDEDTKVGSGAEEPPAAVNGRDVDANKATRGGGFY